MASKNAFAAATAAARPMNADELMTAKAPRDHFAKSTWAEWLTQINEDLAELRS